MKYSLLIFSGLFLGFQAASAQVCLRKGTNKGIYVDRTVSRTEIVMQFGQPERTLAHEDEAAGGYMEIYEYERLKIAVVDGVLYDFSFSRDDLQVTVYEKYSLNVGDQYKAFLDAIPASDIMCRTYDGEVQLFLKLKERMYFMILLLLSHLIKWESSTHPMVFSGLMVFTLCLH